MKFFILNLTQIGVFINIYCEKYSYHLKSNKINITLKEQFFKVEIVDKDKIDLTAENFLKYFNQKTNIELKDFLEEEDQEEKIIFYFNISENVIKEKLNLKDFILIDLSNFYNIKNFLELMAYSKISNESLMLKKSKLFRIPHLIALTIINKIKEKDRKTLELIGVN